MLIVINFMNVMLVVYTDQYTRDYAPPCPVVPLDYNAVIVLLVISVTKFIFQFVTVCT